MLNISFSKTFIICAAVAIIIIISIIAYFSLKVCFSTYPKLKKILEKIKGNDLDFMNFGLWRDNPRTIADANTALCNLLVKNGGINKSKNILDVGFGFGQQDLLWYNSSDVKNDLRIRGVDIEPVHIEEATKLIAKNHLSDKIKFELGDACHLKYNDETFDTVISLESAFHYQPRSTFFREAARVLEPGGKLVIGDIMLQHKCGFLAKYASYLAADFLHVPSCNNQDLDAWVEQLERSGFNVEYEVITRDTFVPYFDHIIKHFDHEDFIIRWCWFFAVNSWRFICKRSLPFDYVVAVCTKK